MKSFEYKAPASLDEAVILLAEKGDRARPLAGGTDILVQLRDGRFDLDYLVDVKRIPELNELSFDPSDGLTIGAAAPCSRIYRDARVLAHYPALVDSASIIGGMAIQGRATFGGNLCNAAPSADSVPSMIVLGGTCSVVGPKGARRVPVERFNLAVGRDALEQGELLVSLHFPVPQPHSGARYLRFIPRNEMDIALVAEAAAACLEGKPVSDEAIDLAADLAQAAARSRTTMRGTADQRRYLVGVHTRRALWGAIRRAKGENEDGR